MFNSSMPNPEDLPTSAQLLKSTIIAIGAAIVLLVVAVLPAEYGIDPTGAGRLLGLTEMGEIKTQLAEEAEADRVRDLQNQVEAQRAASTIATAPAPVATQPVESSDPDVSESDTASAAVQAPTEPEWQDSISITLQPGDATEVKLTMQGGDVVTYEWTVDQAGLNSDLHGDNPQNDFISYRQGRNEAGDAGEFEAAFDGAHGWFWRNRADVTVTVTLRIRGEYSELNRLF
ncbi:transmembrane anchor protein [Maricaulis sp.]|uniref:transmembrane anchor protein n=1 Tax=Maricaulis sp. TaxID=1486257 RepID=UPI000C4671F1|nr:transmembrane anchor protein [Maricaulis sp.]MAC90724.1 transmembrane anchor protein [Maricaulis sp.]